MTVSRDIRLNVTAEVKRYVAEMAKIPGVTEKQAAAAGRSLARELAKAEREAAKNAADTARKITREHNRAAKSLGGAGSAAHRAKEQLEGLKFAAQGAGGRIGEMAGRVENFARSFASLGAVGGPVAAVTAGLAAAGLAAVAFGAAMVKVVKSAGEAAEALEPLKGTALFPAEEVQRVEQANEALAGLGASMRVLLVQFGSSLTPLVEGAATALTGLALSMSEWVEGMGATTLTLRQTMATYFESMVMPLQKFFTMAADGLIELARLTGREAPNALIRYKARWQDVGQVFAGPVTSAIEGVGDAMGVSMDRARSFASLAGQSAEDHAEAVEEETATIVEQVKVVDELSQAFARLAESKRIGKKGAEFDKALVLEAEALRAQKEATEAQAKAASDTAGTYTDTYVPALSAVSSLFGTISTSIRQNSRESAIASKAAGLVQAAINTAVGVTAALPNIPLAIATGAAGAAQVAAIAAQPIPAFAGGGFVPGSAPAAYRDARDERLVTARPGEAIFTPDQLEALGGRDPAPMYVIEMEGRTLGHLVERDARRYGPLTRRVNRSGIRQYGRG